MQPDAKFKSKDLLKIHKDFLFDILVVLILFGSCFKPDQAQQKYSIWLF